MKNFKSYLEQLEFDPKLWNSFHAKWVTNIRLVILLIIVILCAGLVSMFTLPRRRNPEVKIPIVIISTVLPGAGPEDVESLVTKPLEDVLIGIDKLDTITSSSQDNVSVITMQFPSSVDKDKARDNAQSLVDSVTLPEDAQLPKVTALDFENVPVWTFALSSKTDPGSLMRFADSLKTTLEDIPSVKNVSVSGFETQEITVTLDPQKMRDYGITPFALSQALKGFDASYPAGSINSSRSAFSLTIDPFVNDVNSIRNIHIVQNDNTIKLGDIATVVEKTSPNINRSFIANNTTSSRQAVVFDVFKTSSANIDETASVVEKKVEEVLKTRNGAFSVTTVLNSGHEISKQYMDLLGDFESTIILVFINLFLFLGLRQALLASLTIPLTFLSGLIFMNFFGLTINFISLFAFLLALGTSIDDTIVTVASMTTYYRSGKFTPAETGLLVWRDFIVPIWSTTITTIWAFLPLLLTTGIIGEYIKTIPIVVTATMISSTFFAVTVTLPLLIVILKPFIPKRVVVLLRLVLLLVFVGILFAFVPRTSVFPLVLLSFGLFLFVLTRVRTWLMKSISSQPLVKNFGNRAHGIMTHGIINSAWLGNRYQRVISRILASKHGRRNTLIMVIGFALFSYMLVPTGFVKNEFFPKTDEDLIYINLELPAGTSSSVVEPEALRIAEDLRTIPDVMSVVTGVGETFNGQSASANASSAFITLLLKDKKIRTKTSIDLAQTLREKYRSYSSGKLTVQELSGGPPAGSDIQIKLLGDDLAVLDRYADAVAKYLKTQKGVTDVAKSTKSGTSKLVFVPDQMKLADAHVTVDQIGLILRTYASGFTLDTVKFGNKEKDVLFRMNGGTGSTDELGTISIQTQNGSVPLLSLGSLKLEYNPTVITREGGKRTISVTAGIKQGFVIADVNKNLETFANKGLHLPSGYTWQTGGVNEENTKSVQSIFQAMGLSFLLILVTMVIQFGSYRQAAIVLLLIPLAISGVFIVFAITATPLSFPALIGILALFGVVVTNAMFIVDKINRNRKEGMDLEHAIADAAESRLEPIMLTSLTTILGLVPITISDPLWRGLGGAIIAGLSFSGIIMLFFVPVVYYSWFKERSSSASA